MAEASGLWELLRQTADGEVVAALESEVAIRARSGAQPHQFPVVRRGARTERGSTISALVHASRLGLVRHVVEHALSQLRRRSRDDGGAEDAQSLAILLLLLRARQRADARPTGRGHVHGELRERGASPRMIRIRFLMRNICGRFSASSGADIPDDVETAVGKVTLDAIELQPGEKAAMSLVLPKGTILAFDPVTHATLSLRRLRRGDQRKAQLCRSCSPTPTPISAR